MALITIGAFSTVDSVFVHPGATMALYYLCLLNGVQSQYTPWKLGDTTLPSKSYCHAAGYDDYTGSVWIMGGIDGYYTRLMSFNVTSHAFINHGNVLPIDVSESR
eukprot:122393_1